MDIDLCELNKEVKFKYKTFTIQDIDKETEKVFINAKNYYPRWVNVEHLESAEDNYITYLNIDKIRENVEECMDSKTRESFEAFRSQDIDMCYAHKDILEICENVPEDASKEVFNEAIDEIIDIAMQHSTYWREE